MQSAHEEGGERSYLASTVEFLGNDGGEVRAIRVAETEFVDGRRVPKSGTEREIPVDLVLIAMGFTGPERALLEDQLGTQFTERGNVQRADDFQATAPGVFVAGDAGRGQSLIVWAIAEGRAVAAHVDTVPHGRDRACPRRSPRPISRSACSPRRLAEAPRHQTLPRKHNDETRQDRGHTRPRHVDVRDGPRDHRRRRRRRPIEPEPRRLLRSRGQLRQRAQGRR